jgi:hypothetical protein
MHMRNSHLTNKNQSNIGDISKRLLYWRVSWVVTPYSSEGDLRFGGTYRFHLQGRRVSQVRNQQNQVIRWRWRLYIPPKCSACLPTTRRYNPQDRTFHSYRCENLKSSVLLHLFFLRFETSQTLLFHRLGPVAFFLFRINSGTVNSFRHLVGLPGWGIGLFQGLCPHR